jgi:hypothetical protein
MMVASRERRVFVKAFCQASWEKRNILYSSDTALAMRAEKRAKMRRGIRANCTAATEYEL